MVEKWCPRKVVPSFRSAPAVFTNQHRARCKLSNTLENGKRRWGVSKPEKQVKRNRVHGWLSAVCSEDRTNFRTEGHGPIVDLVINELDTHGIAHHDQPLLHHIPDSDTKHAIEAIQDICAPLLVTMNDYL